MIKIEKNSDDIMMELNIPFQVYILLFLLIIIYVAFKYFYSSEEIFEFIENSKKINEDEKLNLLTKLNTKINRDKDFLDNSKYYNEAGYIKIYGKKEKENNNSKEINKIRNENKIFIKKNKKVGFSDIIIYENDEFQKQIQ